MSKRDNVVILQWRTHLHAFNRYFESSLGIVCSAVTRSLFRQTKLNGVNDFISLTLKGYSLLEKYLKDHIWHFQVVSGTPSISYFLVKKE